MFHTEFLKLAIFFILLLPTVHNYTSLPTQLLHNYQLTAVVYAGVLFRRGSPNSVEDRRQREQGSGVSSPLVRGSAQFANE
jgi:hypothetical protein